MKKLFLAAAFAAVVLRVVPAAAMAEGHVFVYAWEDESETSATWFWRSDLTCDTTTAGASDGVVQCHPVNSAPWGEPFGSAPVSIMDLHAPVSILD